MPAAETRLNLQKPVSVLGVRSALFTLCVYTARHTTGPEDALLVCMEPNNHDRRYLYLAVVGMVLVAMATGITIRLIPRRPNTCIQIENIEQPVATPTH